MTVFDLDAMIADTQTLIEIESPSGDLAQLHKSAIALASMIERHIGGTCELVESPKGPHVHWKGSNETTVMLLGHHDTVFAMGTLERLPFAVTDGVMTGPGCFDMLAGIVQALHGLASLDDCSHVELLFSADEESGSHESRAFIEERALACGNVLVLEPSADGGGLKTGRKGCGTFDVVITGRASHAGLEPEKGINALVEASHQVLAINLIGDASVGTTVTPDGRQGREHRQRRAGPRADQGRRPRRDRWRKGPSRSSHGGAHGARRGSVRRSQRTHRPPADA